MQFSNPAFLFAVSALAIPLLIHLFNLRRYKTVDFPHSRFLKDIQLQSQKQSKLRYKWLLITRMLFLLFLVMAFAQPFFPSSDNAADHQLRIVYIDNSMSMSAGKAQRNLLETAKENARRLISSHEGSFLVFSNDAPASYEVMGKQAALNAVDRIQLSANTKDAEQILRMIDGITQGKGNVDVYYLSDFQRNQFDPARAAEFPARIHFNGVQLQNATGLSNVYIDTAYLEYPSLQNEKQNRLIVRSRYSGTAPTENPVLQLRVDGAAKSAATLDFGSVQERVDTLSFETAGVGWHRLSLSVNDLSTHFDDTLLIAAKSAADLSILLVTDAQPNVFVQAALRSYPGFKVRESSAGSLPDDRNNANLILLSNVNQISPQLAEQLASALNAGVNVCLLPGANVDPARMSAALKPIADLEWLPADTVAQTASELRQEHPMIRDLFERIPENIQLPFVRMHYPIRAGVNADAQSIISFRNGDPFFLACPSGNAQMFLCSTPADPNWSNFQNSYFFVPFLYQMASLSQSGDLFSVFAGQSDPVFVTVQQVNASKLFHLKDAYGDRIPAQRPQGRGTRVDVGAIADHAGFYTLSNESGDSSIIGVNLSRKESDLNYWKLTDLRNSWHRKGDTWQSADAENAAVSKTALSSFPLWKLCSILALGMLALEVYLLSKKYFRKNTITN